MEKKLEMKIGDENWRWKLEMKIETFNKEQLLGQDLDEWCDVKKVNLAIPIDVGFKLKRSGGQ